MSAVRIAALGGISQISFGKEARRTNVRQTIFVHVNTVDPSAQGPGVLIGEK